MASQTSQPPPKVIGPYQPFVHAGELVFLSGQIPLDPKTGQILEGDIRAQTEQVMRNLDSVLREAGASFARVVRTTIFLADMADFAAVNEVYGAYLEPPYPARATVQVAALPRGARIEIDAVAYLGAAQTR